MIRVIVITFCLFSLISYAQLFANNDSISVKNLDEVIVTAKESSRNLRAAEMGRHIIDQKDILKLSVLFGEPDIVKNLQVLPGVSQGIEGFTGLYVHGGDNDQNLFLYNGLPLYHVSHIGGIFSSFNVSTIRNIDFFKSSFPARYGGRISSVTSINMVNPDFERYTGKFTVGLLAVNGYVSGPIIKEKVAFSAAARRSWIDIIGVPALLVANAVQKKNGKKNIVNYYFMDFNARVDCKFDEGNVYAICYYGKDYLKIGERQFESTADSYVVGWSDAITKSPNEARFYDEDRNRLSWGNWGASLNADYYVGSGTVNTMLYCTRYFSDYRQENEYQSNLDDPTTYGYTLNGTRNSIADVGVNAQYTKQWKDAYLLKVGAGYVHHNYHPEGLTNEYVDDSNSWYSSNDNPLVKSSEVFGYLDNLFNFGKIASLDMGCRFVYHDIQGKSFHRLEPRVSLRVNVTDDYSIKASYALANQFVQQISSNYITLPTDLWQPIAQGMKPLSSDQYSMGVYGNLTTRMYFSLEGWYKSMKNLVEYKEGVSTFNPNLTWEEKSTVGEGWAYGVDFNLKNEMGKLKSTIAYGLLWNWRKFAELNQGLKFPAKFDNRHKININASYSLNEQIEFNAGWTYMTGNRLTLSLYNYDEISNLFPDAPTTGIGDSGFQWEQVSGLDYYSSRNNIRMPSYHRLDIGVSLYKKLCNGKRIVWNFSVYNAYCRMNTMTIHKDNYVNNTRLNRAFQKFSLIPIVPSVSYTYEF